MEPRGWAKMGTTWGQMWGPKLDQRVDQKWDQRVDQKWDQRVDPKWDQRVDQKCFLVFLCCRRNLVKSCCDSFAKEQFCMKTMKIKNASQFGWPDCRSEWFGPTVWAAVWVHSLVRAGAWLRRPTVGQGEPVQTGLVALAGPGLGGGRGQGRIVWQHVRTHFSDIIGDARD